VIHWTSEQDEEFEELMDAYPVIEPALERAVRVDERLDRIEALLDVALGKKDEQ